MAILGHIDVLGVPVAAATREGALDLMAHWIESGDHQYVTFTGIHGVMESKRRVAVLEAHRSAGMVSCDGMPLVWICRRLGFPEAERVYGPDLMLALTERARRENWGVFLYGGSPSTSERLVGVLAQRYAGLRVAGAIAPPFRELTPDEDQAIVAEINASKPEILFVGLSTPKQECWMAKHVGRLKANLMLGVGAAFDYHAGRIPQAPAWMQRAGLEWIFRIRTEPGRLAGRYLRNNPAFLWQIMLHPPRVISRQAREGIDVNDLA
jgi:N-acetylglucosaminyldiphosphoundecaprenol N-acetyl-beta-D-mannosaminyltransferase